MAKKTLIDRKHPEVALVEISKVLNQLDKNTTAIERNVSKIVVSAEVLDKDYQNFKAKTVADISAIAGSFESDSFDEDYLASLEGHIDEIGVMRKAERESITDGEAKTYALTSGGIYLLVVGEINVSADIGIYVLIAHETTTNIVELAASTTVTVSAVGLALSVSFTNDNYELALYVL